jgi:hypothetical protein
VLGLLGGGGTPVPVPIGGGKAVAEFFGTVSVQGQFVIVNVVDVVMV